jgi:hypothetical protein
MTGARRKTPRKWMNEMKERQTECQNEITGETESLKVAMILRLLLNYIKQTTMQLRRKKNAEDNQERNCC